MSGDAAAPRARSARRWWLGPADSSVPASIGWWQTQIRRALLVAHLLPSALGLLAVILLGGNAPIRRLDVAVWTLATAWAAFLLVAGWRRGTAGRRLAAWVLADAVVMAALQFVGTSARNAVTYASIDGALFATIFVSTAWGLVQITVAYSGLAAAGIARASGSTLSSPLIGWRSPLAVTVISVLTFQFVRVALESLREAAEGHEALTIRRRIVAGQAAAQEARIQGLAAIERELMPSVNRLVDLTTRYAPPGGAGQASHEARWLRECVGEVQSDFSRLRDISEPAEFESLEELIDTGILGSSAARLLDVPVTRNIAPDAEAVTLGGAAAACVIGFVREATSNAAIHGAPPVAIAATLRADGVLTLRVSDGGGGFDPAKIERGLGLDALDRLAIGVGGEVTHAQPSDDRHEVTLSLPVSR